MLLAIEYEGMSTMLTAEQLESEHGVVDSVEAISLGHLGWELIRIFQDGHSWVV